MNCHFKHLSTSVTEKDKCCNKGKVVVLPPEESGVSKLLPLSPTFLRIISDTDHFSNASSLYNNPMSLAATGVDNGKGGGWENDMAFPHASKICGRTYHFLPPATTSTTDPSCGLSYFAFDTRAAMFNRFNEVSGNVRSAVENDILQDIYNELRRDNIFCQELEHIGQQQVDEFTVQAINTRITAFEVGAITSDTATGNRKLVINLNSPHVNRSPSTNIDVTDPWMEPLVYPLFFTRGEDGWGEKYKKCIDFMPYLASRILLPEYNEDGSPFLLPSKLNQNVLLHVNRFQVCSRLRQMYIIDMVSRAIDYRLSWHSNNQGTIFGGASETRYNAQNHVVELVPEDETKTFLSSSLTGSRRHLRKKANESLTLASEKGLPSVFITMTTNTEWPEIQSQLLPGQTAYDREDIVCMAFKHRLDHLLQSLKDGKYFPNKVVYVLRVIEYQHR